MNFDGNNYNNNGYGNGYNNYGYGTAAYQQSGITMADYSRRVYAYMAAGLSITFILGFAIQRMLASAFTDPAFVDGFIGIYMVTAVVELIMVFILGFFIYKLPSAASAVLFIVYSICNGITIAPTLMLAGIDTAIYAFAATALLFGAFSIYGLLTKRDLTKLRPILMIGLIVLLLYAVVAMFFRMPMADLGISLLGIIIFIGFTAYDTQKIKKGYEYFSGDPTMLKKSSINIALELYLDFINLFLYILRLFARNR